MSKTGISRRRLMQGAVGVAVFLATGKGGQILLAANGANGESKAEQLSIHEADTLRQMVRRLFPYQELGDEPYQLVVGAAQDNKSVPGVAGMLREGVRLLDATVAGGSWLALPEKRQLPVLTGIETSSFFQFMLNISIHGLHSNQELWSLIGYQGSSVEHGGYIRRGFNDIDWLPEDAS